MTGLPANIDWKDARTHKPARPETPYHVYLVWIIQKHPRASGTTYLWQFDRDLNDWAPLPLGPTGAPMIVTHYSEVLDVLGYPGPNPFGPRGDEYL